MNCDECEHNSKACNRVRDINGLLGSMDCDKTPEKIRWLVNTHLVYGWAVSRFKICVEMLTDRMERPEDFQGSTPEYFKQEMAKIQAKLKEQYDTEPK